MEIGDLQTNLRRLLAATKNEVQPPGFWVGDKAAERRVNDDLHSGALAFRAAHEHAKRGLRAVDQGDVAVAKLALREGKTLLAEAHERQLSKHALETLRTGSKPRGRKTKTEDRDLALARAVEAKVKEGFSRVAACAAAIKCDPMLTREFDGLGKPAVRASLRRGQRLLSAKA